MPDEGQHLRKAEANEQFVALLDLDKEPSAEWAITALFYSAVHLVEARFAATFGLHCTTHEQRKKNMSRDRKTKSCFPDYAHLETLSRDCRYQTNIARRGKFDKDAKPRYDAIKKTLAPRLP